MLKMVYANSPSFRAGSIRLADQVELSCLRKKNWAASESNPLSVALILKSEPRGTSALPGATLMNIELAEAPLASDPSKSNIPADSGAGPEYIRSPTIARHMA